MEPASVARVVLALFVCTMGIAHASSAQESQSLSPAEAAERTREVERWVHDYQRWQEWRHQWLKKGSLGLDKRKPQPQPPTWLAEACHDTPPPSGTLEFDACDLLIDWTMDYVEGDLRYQMAKARADREAPKKTSWWEHIHFDAYWPMMRSDASVFGVVGAHATVEIEGRFQVFVTPGVMILSVPTAQGTREWKPATDWGFAYRLFDFRVPGTHRTARLHVNFVRAWILGNVGVDTFNSHMDLAGFSVTFKKPPR
jgi:hypothetical protein